MISHIQSIYNKFCLSEEQSSTEHLSVEKIIKWSDEQIKQHSIYKELIDKLRQLKVKGVDRLFIERFCLDKLSVEILSEYPVNVAEAFALSFIQLNKPVALEWVMFKLGMSGLLVPTLINGTKIQDIEAIAQFIIKSLEDAKLIRIFRLKYLLMGDQFHLFKGTYESGIEYENY